MGGPLNVLHITYLAECRPGETQGRKMSCLFAFRSWPALLADFLGRLHQDTASRFPVEHWSWTLIKSPQSSLESSKNGGKPGGSSGGRQLRPEACRSQPPWGSRARDSGQGGNCTQTCFPLLIHLSAAPWFPPSLASSAGRKAVPLTSCRWTLLWVSDLLAWLPGVAPAPAPVECHPRVACSSMLVTAREVTREVVMVFLPAAGQ